MADTTENPYVIPNLDPEDDNLLSMFRELDQLRAEAEDNETKQKHIKERLRDALGANGVSEFETPQYKMSMIYPEDRASISKEKLLLNGVDIQKIIAATDTKPVAPYVLVKRKKEPKA